MDQVYSWTLLASLVCGCVALFAATAVRVLPLRGLAWSRVIISGSVAACAMLIASFAVHLAWGHRPGTPTALAPVEFVVQHPSFVVAALLPACALIIGARRGSK